MICHRSNRSLITLCDRREAQLHLHSAHELQALRQQLQTLHHLPNCGHSMSLCLSGRLHQSTRPHGMNHQRRARSRRKRRSSRNIALLLQADARMPSIRPSSRARAWQRPYSPTRLSHECRRECLKELLRVARAGDRAGGHVAHRHRYVLCRACLVAQRVTRGVRRAERRRARPVGQGRLAGPSMLCALPKHP